MAQSERRRAVHEGKVRRERETVEAALDLVAFRGELVAGVQALRGMKLRRID
jgi:hypothetical protein